MPKVQIETAVERFPPIRGCSKNTISCFIQYISPCLVQIFYLIERERESVKAAST